MMMMRMRMNFLCGMFTNESVLSLISRCWRFSPLQMSDMLWTGFESVQNLTLALLNEEVQYLELPKKLPKET